MDTPLGKEFKKFRIRVGVALAIISFGCGVGIWQSRSAGEDAQRAITQLSSDRITNINESCTQKERKWISNIRSVKITYQYFDSLPSSEVSSTFNQLIIKEFPRTYNQYKFDKPLTVCSKEGFGLDRPVEELPPYRDYSYLLISK